MILLKTIKKKEANMKKVKLMTVGVVAMAIQGCSSVASVGASMGVNPQLFETEKQCKEESYPKYVQDMQVVNNAKIEQHQTLEPVMTVQQYCHLKNIEKPTDNQK